MQILYTGGQKHVLLLNTYRGHRHPLFIYLSNQARIEVQRLPKDALQPVVRLQLDLGGVWLLLHKMKKRIHLPLGEGQHRVQIIHHPIWWTEGERKKEKMKGWEEQGVWTEGSGGESRANCKKMWNDFNSSPKLQWPQCVCLASQSLWQTLETVYSVRQEPLDRRALVLTQSWLLSLGGLSAEVT